MDSLIEWVNVFSVHAQKVVFAILDPNSRIYAVYLLTSLLAAYLVYRSARATLSSDEKSFLKFLFPKKVWSNPSAWLDLRYYIFHSLTGKFLILGLGVSMSALVFRLIAGDVDVVSLSREARLSWGADFAITLGYMMFSAIVADGLGYFCHWLQHKSPLLWQFHKVHHSAEVMHPVSNFREHPIDNILYNAVIGAGFGACIGLFVRVFNYVPSVPSLLGVPILMLLFNVVGYNLRHSHIWLRWPGKWSMVFPSPAHHHVHHSYHPDHIDKNFAFMFPFWDVIFKTYSMPETNKDVKFGIGEGNADELDTCARLYWVPFRDALRVLRMPRNYDRAFDMSKPPKPEDIRAAKTHPAE